VGPTAALDILKEIKISIPRRVSNYVLQFSGQFLFITTNEISRQRFVDLKFQNSRIIAFRNEITLVLLSKLIFQTRSRRTT